MNNLGHGSKDRYFLSFAGGGAKGLVHVGALSFLEKQSDIDIAGVSGTSAGALIATLYSIGYKSDEIIGSDGNSKLFIDIQNTRYCQNHGLSKIRGIDGLFDKNTFLAIRFFKLPFPSGLKAAGALWFLRGPFRAGLGFLARAGIAVVLSALMAGFISRMTAEFLPGLLLGALGGFFLYMCCICLTFVGISKVGAEMLDAFADQAMRGFSNIEVFREVFSELISQKVHGVPDKIVTFSDLPKLSIIATDVNTGQAVVFSEKTSPHHSVADALCASMAIPALFKIQKIGESDYCDGGVVSNLPSWVFDIETKMHSRAKVIAINIVSGEAHRRRRLEDLRHGKGFKRLKAAFFLLLDAFSGGSQKINLRAESGVREFTIPTSLVTSDFDADTNRRLSAVDNGRIALSRMMEFCRIGPAAYSYICELIRDDAVASLQEIYEILNAEKKVSRSKIRVSIAMPSYNRNDIIRLKFSSGFYSFSHYAKRWIPHPDLGLILPASRSVAGQAISNNRPEFRTMSHDDFGFLDHDDDHDIICRVRRGIKWVYAEPMKTEGAGNVSYAISIDGGSYLTDFDRYTDASEAKVLREYFFEAVRESIKLNLQDVSDIVGRIPSMEDCDDAHRT